MGGCLAVSPLTFPLSPFFLFLRFRLLVENEAAHRGRASPWLERPVRIRPILMKLFGLFGDWTVAGNLQDQHPAARPVRVKSALFLEMASMQWLAAASLVTLPPTIGVQAGTAYQRCQGWEVILNVASQRPLPTS